MILTSPTYLFLKKKSSRWKYLQDLVSTQNYGLVLKICRDGLSCSFLGWILFIWLPRTTETFFGSAHLLSYLCCKRTTGSQAALTWSSKNKFIFLFLLLLATAILLSSAEERVKKVVLHSTNKFNPRVILEPCPAAFNKSSLNHKLQTKN